MKILVLTSSTGGGHDMRARSLKAWSETEQARALGVEVEIYQVLENLTPLYRFGVHFYNWIQLNAPWFHHVYFNFLEFAQLHRSADGIPKKARQSFIEKVSAARPSLVVSTHAHLNHAFFDLARRACPGLACVTYCGELHGGYGFSKLWVNPDADGFFAAVEPCFQAALHHGMPEEKTFHGGFLLHPAFWNPLPSVEEQAAFVETKLGMTPGRFLLVLSTGANSANNHLALLNSLSRCDGLQVAVLCGNDKATAEAVTAWAKNHPHLTVKTLPRLDSEQMHQLISAASAVVARPGTGSTSEAILCGCPLIHNGIGGVMPQEVITLRFMQSHGALRLMRRPSELACLIRPLMHGEALKAAREQMLKLRPSAHPVGLLAQLVKCASKPAD